MESIKKNLQRKSKPAFYVQCPSFENCAVSEIMWKSMVYPERPQMTIYGTYPLHVG